MNSKLHANVTYKAQTHTYGDEKCAIAIAAEEVLTGAKLWTQLKGRDGKPN